MVEVVNSGSLAPGDNVRVTIPWRRHDQNPGAKAVLVVDAASNQPVKNVRVLHSDNTAGDLIFQPNRGSSLYYVYYMPWQTTGGYYPKVTYPKSVIEPDAEWVEAAGKADPDALARARTMKIQSVNAFHSFFPMEVVATPDEAARFMKGAPNGSRVMPEHRDFPVRMRHFLPKHWTDHGPEPLFESRVLRDEFFTFQVAVVAGAAPLADVRVSFEQFPSEWQKTLTCFNCGGVDENGRAFGKVISVNASEVQPLWIGVMVPLHQPEGTVEGKVVVSTSAGDRQAVTVRLDGDRAQARNHGYDEPELMSRLAWLNSTAGADPEFIIDPFTPVVIGGPIGGNSRFSAGPWASEPRACPIAS